MKTTDIMARLQAKYPTEKEYLQAVQEVLESIEDVYNQHPEFEKAKIVERLVEPDRIFSFRVTWIDDKGEVQTNTGYRIQFNSAIGPYKGGLRFHKAVTPSMLKFLGFEQTFKNALTTLPMGGAKGGSDFDPVGKSNEEIMRFCQAFMLELWNCIGPDQDIPAGDVGVGGREIGYMYGMYKKLAREYNTGVLTGKGSTWGGSILRPEATGFGACYFAQEMLATRGESFQGKTVVISGAGNVAQYAAKKAMQLGAKVVTLSDSDGFVYDPDGLDEEKWQYVMTLKNMLRGRIREYAVKYPKAQYFEGQKPWGVKCDIAMPCATQNEINGEAAKTLVANGCFCVTEGANMPSTPEAVEVFQNAGILYSPGKASNAGGVATSGLEMSQNSIRQHWTAEEVDAQLHRIMSDIHASCAKYGSRPDGSIDYVKGANLAGFIKVAWAMVDQGIV